MSSKAADLLSQLSQTAVSGETLAKRLNISRVAVWKQIRALQAVGVSIHSQGRRGYALQVKADPSLATLRFSGALEPWAKSHYVISTGSTQSLARHAALQGIPEGHFWIAETQSRGRGRLGRAWSSGFGGLWFSLVLRPQVPPSRASSIGLLAALALTQTIQAVTGKAARLKWPNDILIGGKKVAGFLTEMSGEIDKTDWILLGVGLNVFNRIPPELESIAVGLEAGSYTRAQILQEFLKRFYESYRLWQRKGFEPFRKDYWRFYSRPNKPARLKTAQGPLRGTIRGVDASGAIILESRRKIRSILEGEITL